MAKSKDELLEEIEKDSPKPMEEDEDQVTAAYEHINRRLESLKKGELGEEDEAEEEAERTGSFIKDEDKRDEDESDEPEDKDEDEDDDSDDDEEEDKSPGDILDEESGSDKDDDSSPTDSQDEEELDPLEDEDSDRSEDSDKSEDQNNRKSDREESDSSDDTDSSESLKSESSEPDTLDDLTKEEPPASEPAFKRHEEPARPPREESFSRSSLTDYEQSNLEIPNLRHKNAGVSFGDTPFEREDIPAQRQNPFSTRYDAPPRRSGGNKIHLLILVLIGLAVIGGTVYLLKGQFDGVAPSPTPEATSEPLPTPEPTPEFDRAKYKLRVLNGTATSGLAGSASAKLKDLGYQIDRTGNAPRQNYKVAEIKVKPSATGLSDQLIKDLSSDFPNASAAGELKDTDAADAEVILGQE